MPHTNDKEAMRKSNRGGSDLFLRKFRKNWKLIPK